MSARVKYHKLTVGRRMSWCAWQTFNEKLYAICGCWLFLWRKGKY
ncbi:hypothetical protein X880_1196 [Burkholderia pseudomallei MSHR4032]|nr:hypothetical protein Y038_1528 [Burkholderia pseudomallei MSHR543]KGU99438.1 hypothetical protein X880_1196 [Burkholderia pseudomallei MSHR4032]CAJ4015789.1 Uncharacterised protein [Burkholderia pseudomallei]CAJ7222265.1 Uncharacterised protein [Burkholderia pseudomallei]